MCITDYLQWLTDDGQGRCLVVARHVRAMMHGSTELYDQPNHSTIRVGIQELGKPSPGHAGPFPAGPEQLESLLRRTTTILGTCKVYTTRKQWRSYRVRT